MTSLRCTQYLFYLCGIPSILTVIFCVRYMPSNQQIIHPFITYQQERGGENSQDKFAMFDKNRFHDVSFIKAAVTDTYSSYLIPRAAFFDKRIRGKYKNATVILTHITKSHLKVTACIVDNHHVSELVVKSINLNKWIHVHHPKLTHDDVMIFCFDTPAHNNSKVSVVYENPKNVSEYFIIESEYPLFIPESRENAKTFSSSIMVCTTVYGSPPYFGAWLRYQKTLGVDLVYVNAIQSFLSNQASNDSFFQESVRNGFVQLMVWKEYLKPGAIFYHSQLLYYQGCIYRFQGVYNYAIMADVDDFLIPSGGEINRILSNIYNPRPKLGSIRLEWIRYFEPKGGFNFTADTIIADGNLTRYVDISLGSMVEHNYKSIHKLVTTLEVGVHIVSEQMKGYMWIEIPRNNIYMVHIKKHKIDNT